MTLARPLRKQANAEQGRSYSVDAEIAAGLSAAVPHVSPKYLYDPLGSKLFEAITELPEYYPTRTEKAIFERHIGAIAREAGDAPTLIELGAGNGEKAAALFPALRPGHYVAIDISAEFLERSIANLRKAHPDIPMTAVAADITRGISLPSEVRPERRLFMYLGSSIGNFDPAEALALLRAIREACAGDGALLIGADLVKPAEVLNAAYDDALGVTAAFNLNLLNHLNTLAGTNFRLRDWKHVARFNAIRARVEMHLEARRDVLVAWPGGSRHFREGERIHTENSHKYTLAGLRELLERAGFSRTSTWTDEQEWFAVCLAHA